MKLLLVLLPFALLAVAEATFPIGQQCPDYCVDLWNPVCGENARCTALFGNPCKYDYTNCNTIRREQFRVVEMSRCNFLRLDSYNSIKCR